MDLFVELCSDTVDTSLYLASDKHVKIQQLAYSLLLKQPVTVWQVMSWLVKTTFFASGHA